MLFNSLIFIPFLLVVFSAYWLINFRYRNILLLIASYYFYFSYNPWFLFLLIGTSLLDYYLAKLISTTENNNTRKLYLIISLLSNIGVLFVFKYFVFFYNTSVQIFNLETSLLHQLIIPAGLSFYTFQSISYTIDVYRKKYQPTDTVTDFLLYVSFFPHMVAGPIVRYNDLMPQFKVRQYFKNINWEQVAKLIIWGYFKKMVIADNLSNIVTPIFKDVTHYSGGTLLFAGFLFVIQVYCDFSGYSDIATGVAKLFKINLSLNWRRPLFSKSLQEFWTRNHISITNWFRDYLYIGLGGNRVGYSRWLLNIFLVFLISGFWHGANFTFVIWGSLHGVFYIAEILLKKKFPNYKAPKFLGWIYLISFHTLSLIAFRALSVNDLGFIYKSIFCHFNFSNSIHQLIAVQGIFCLLAYLTLIAFLFLKECQEEFMIIKSSSNFVVHFLKPLFYIVVLLSIFLLGNFKAKPFIYFQF